MITKDLIKGSWQRFYDWEKMRSVNDNLLEDEEEAEAKEYSEADFDNFVEIVFRQVAENLCVKYDYIKDILYGRNVSFFECKAKIFSEMDTITSDYSCYKFLTAMLLVPAIPYNRPDRVGRFIEDFKDLKCDEQAKILEAFSKATINWTKDLKESSPGTFIGNFHNMSSIYQYKFLSSVFDTTIELPEDKTKDTES